MKLKQGVAAAALSLASLGAVAANVDFNLIDVGDNAYGNIYQFNNFNANGSSIWDDTFTFLGALPGDYLVKVGGNTQLISGLTGTLNGIALTITGDSEFGFYKKSGTFSQPFVLDFGGTGTASSQMAGNITVTAVPEPETYALMLAGLGLMGFIARRRRPQQ